MDLLYKQEVYQIIGACMAVYNDKGHDVEVFFDRDLWESDAFQFHPLVNTSTIVITRDNMERFLNATGHVFQIINVPAR